MTAVYIAVWASLGLLALSILRLSWLMHRGLSRRQRRADPMARGLFVAALIAMVQVAVLVVLDKYDGEHDTGTYHITPTQHEHQSR